MRLSTTTLTIIAIAVLVALAVFAVVAWFVTRQPPLVPLDIPSASVG